MFYFLYLIGVVLLIQVISTTQSTVGSLSIMGSASKALFVPFFLSIFYLCFTFKLRIKILSIQWILQKKLQILFIRIKFLYLVCRFKLLTVRYYCYHVILLYLSLILPDDVPVIDKLINLTFCCNNPKDHKHNCLEFHSTNR